jgi:YgiT-type zinc finger domain-containing protein
MLDKNTGAFPPPSTCERDQGAQRLVSSRRSVPFLRIGGVTRIEVMGIPALQCQVCDEQIYDLTLLAQIERALHGRVAQGSTETQYTFEQLAAELPA